MQLDSSTEEQSHGDVDLHCSIDFQHIPIVHIDAAVKSRDLFDFTPGAIEDAAIATVECTENKIPSTYLIIMILLLLQSLLIVYSLTLSSRMSRN